MGNQLSRNESLPSSSSSGQGINTKTRGLSSNESRSRDIGDEKDVELQESKDPIVTKSDRKARNHQYNLDYVTLNDEECKTEPVSETSPVKIVSKKATFTRLINLGNKHCIPFVVRESQYSIFKALCLPYTIFLSQFNQNGKPWSLHPFR